MKYPTFILLLIASTILAKADPISKLVEDLSRSHTWTNGGYPKLAALENASHKDVIFEYCAKSSFQDGTRIKEITIIEERNVTITGPLPDTYIALSCKTDHGPRIFIIQFNGKLSQWWIQMHEPEDAERAGAGQPATHPESKSESSDKPQHESDGRSR